MVGLLSPEAKVKLAKAVEELAKHMQAVPQRDFEITELTIREVAAKHHVHPWALAVAALENEKVK